MARTRARAAGVTALLAALALAAPACRTTPEERAAEPPAGPPDIVLLIADDQGWADLSCAGLAADVDTPNLDRLAATGVRFTRAYASSPICNASRMSLMTGCYPQRFGTFWYGGEGLPDEARPTLAELLSAAGYRTGYVGKFHYGKHAVDRPGSRSFPLEHGYEEFYGFAGGRKHYLIHDRAAEDAFLQARRDHDRRGQSLRMGPMWEGEEPVDQEGFSTHLFTERALDFLRRDDERPVFLTVGFNAVHNFTHQLPPEYMEEHGLTGYADWDPAAEPYYDWYRRGRAPNNPEGRAHYLGQLHFLDEAVGRLLDALEARAPERETLIVYIGDNGGSTPIYANNGPLRGSKYTLYEGGLRVPLIVSHPDRIASGELRDEVVSGMDLLPTLCAAAGVLPPDAVDGRDLGPLLRADPSAAAHDLLVWDTGHETAVLHGRWKLKTAKSNRHAEYEMVEVELGTFLYDLDADPGEEHDVSAEHPEVVERLQALHAEWRAAL